MNRREAGTRAEKLVIRYLKRRFWSIQYTNYYAQGGEIDIVATRVDMMAFVEVRFKTEKSAEMYGTPAESVTPEKQRRIIKAARQFVQNFRIDYFSRYRFDVAEVIEKSDGKIKINYIKNAFICDMNNTHYIK